MLYTPAANYNGADQFNFTATGPDGPDTATITITITAVNDAPACVGDTSTGDEDTDQTGTVGCTDIDSGALTYSKVGGPSRTAPRHGQRQRVLDLHAGRELQRFRTASPSAPATAPCSRAPSRCR